jgi:hypothetical protein
MKAAASEDLATVRRLSQYRPFERGGASAREAVEDLVLASLAEAGGTFDSVEACRDAVRTLFSLDLDDIEVGRALAALTRERRVTRDGYGFELALGERRQLEKVAEESQKTAATALAEWREFLTESWPSLTSEDLDGLEADLQTFLEAVVRRHGAEAALLLYPEEPAAQSLYESLELEGLDPLSQGRQGLERVREMAVAQIIRKPTDTQKAYLARILNTGYFLTVLSIDPQGAQLVQTLTSGQQVYLDTNFVYRFLGLQGPRYIRPAEVILRLTQVAGYECAVTPWTLDELRHSFQRSKEFLEMHPVPPSEYAALAADATSEDDFVTAYWRRVREQPGLRVKDFVDYFSEMEGHLAKHHITVVRDGCTAVEQHSDEIAREVGLLEQVLHGRPRSRETIEHDVKHWLLVRRLRGSGNRGFANAGVWFLTNDSLLPRYDFLARGKGGQLPFCVSAAAWFQVMEAFRPKTKDFEQTLADMLASPYVRYRASLSKESAQAIVARVDLYRDGTPDLAARVLMNTAAVAKIEAARSDDEQVARIDNAIIAAAKEAKEDADAASQLVVSERQRADTAELLAKRRIGEAEARHQRVVELERRQAQHQLDTERERHIRELAEEKTIRNQLRRKVRIAGAAVGPILALFVILVVGLDTAWSILVVVAVILGIWAAIDQLFLKRFST